MIYSLNMTTCDLKFAPTSRPVFNKDWPVHVTPILFNKETDKERGPDSRWEPNTPCTDTC